MPQSALHQYKAPLTGGEKHISGMEVFRRTFEEDDAAGWDGTAARVAEAEAEGEEEEKEVEVVFNQRS